MIDFKICDFSVEYITQVQELLRQGYERERAHIPFMPPFSETADKTGELQWFAGEKLGFCAVKDDELVRLIDTTEDDGENFISQGSGILNISGMFVREDYRGKGYARCFWEKDFTPYTISLVRRVDVRAE